MLSRDNTVLIVIDIQAKLLPTMHEAKRLVAEVRKLIRGAAVMDVPILWTEQYPRGLGPTVPAVAELLPGRPIAKVSFGCCGEPAFVAALEAVGPRQVLLAGLEAHICVQQTALGLLAAGYDVQVAADAVGSRTPQNRQLALAKLRQAGAVVTSVETALFEMLGAAEGPAFKAILDIVK